MKKTLAERIEGFKERFRIDVKPGAMLSYFGLGYLTPLLGFKEDKKRDLSLEECKEYLTSHFVADHWILKSSRKRLFKNERVYKIESIPHPDSIAARNNLPTDYVWVYVSPDPEKK